MEITFDHVDPSAEPGEYYSKEEPSPYFKLASPDYSLEFMVDRDEVVIPNKPSIKVQFEYPLAKPHIIELKSPSGAGFTRGELALAISLKYQDIYQEEKETSQKPVGSCAELYGGNLLNRAKTNGKWGIWGHRLGDLDLHEVLYDPKRDVYSLSIDS